MKKWLTAGACAVLLSMSACGPDEAASLPPPREPDSSSVAYFCHMSLPEHEGPKAQLFLRGQADPVWFASISEAFMFLATELAQPHDLLAVYVNDMAQGSWEKPAPGAWIDIEGAFYVVGSRRTSAMGEKEAVPFADKAAALTFSQQFGGEVVDFETAKAALTAEIAGGDS
ncbi:nitrous oxide reductase accessory protein NosL [Dongia sp.]|uniref:nitrous oxide reductase accessory protein NosL n=1 Tax=Dongia sp. TaxID=1977262 RepID=UPI0035B29E58